METFIIKTFDFFSNIGIGLVIGYYFLAAFAFFCCLLLLLIAFIEICTGIKLLDN
jgi:hypothetical protein